MSEREDQREEEEEEEKRVQVLVVQEAEDLEQGYSIRNPKGPLAKFPFSPGSGTVTVKIQKHNSNKNVQTNVCTNGYVVWPYLCVTPFCALNLGIKGVRARRRHALVVWLIELLHCMLLGMIIADGFFFLALTSAFSENFYSKCACCVS